jgi:hypothetical protein
MKRGMNKKTKSWLIAIAIIIAVVIVVIIINNQIGGVLFSPSPYKVVNNLDLAQRPSVLDSCRDTDRGFDIYIKGTVAGQENNRPYAYTDYCNNMSNGLNEYYCNGTTWRMTPVNCPCINGACDLSSFNRCFDSDGGINPAQKGYVNGLLNNSGYFYWDVCVNTTFLTENYCSGTLKQSIIINCLNNNGTTHCNNGTCIN